jgi:hypothetical protein
MPLDQAVCLKTAISIVPKFQGVLAIAATIAIKRAIAMPRGVRVSIISVMRMKMGILWHRLVQTTAASLIPMPMTAMTLTLIVTLIILKCVTD